MVAAVIGTNDLREDGVISFAAAGVCVLLGGLAVFQALLALGAPLGAFAWGGQHRVLPTRLRVGSAVSSPSTP